jgi:fructose-bisphosphate aldolase class II
MLASLKALLKNDYAVPAFNAYNIETVQAIIQAGEEARSPLIIQASESALDYAGLEGFAAYALQAIKKTKIPVGLHLDHGKNLDTVRKCVKNGFSSIMLDGSSKSFDENVKISLQAKKIANGIPIELEIGALAGKEDYVEEKEARYTSPEEALRFYNLTKPDALAVSIGNSHGWSEKKLKLNFDLLKQISSEIPAPLVLHGSSGVSDVQIKKAVKLGIRKINMDTQLRKSFTLALKKSLNENPDINPRTHLSKAKDAMKKTCIDRIKVCGSNNKF